MSNHAPGPWTMEDGDFEQPFYIMATSAPPGSRMVCALSASDGWTQAATARLIAAAPDLLAALQEIANNPSPNGRGFGHWAQLVIAAPAIAKATGGDAK